jgi:hypothetical protein
MAQRRSSSGRGDERSDLDDTKALAAKARSTTGGPVVVPNPAELSGVRPRRDSVIGARLTPPPRATSSELPNWFFGVLGFLSVLLVGFGGLFVLGRSGKLDPLLNEAEAPIAAAPVAPVPELAPAPSAAPAPAAEPQPAAPAAAQAQPAPAARAVEPAPPRDEPAPAAAAARGKSSGREAREAREAREQVAAAEPRARAPKAAEQAAPEQAEEESEEAPSAKPARAAAAPRPAETEESEDDQSAPGQDAVEAALDALATRVRGCFVKYQIKGTARVRLVATPAGAAESVTVTGEFEDTPTGMCVEGVIAGAKLPAFKGPPLKLSQSYQLR